MQTLYYSKKHQSNVKSDHFVNILHLYLWVIKKLSCFVQNEFTGTIYRGISTMLAFLLISSIEKFCHSGKIFITTSSQETDTIQYVNGSSSKKISIATLKKFKTKKKVKKNPLN